MKSTKEFFLMLALMLSGMLVMPDASAFGEGTPVMLPGSSPAPLVLDPIEVPHRVPRKERPDVSRPMAANITVVYKTNGSTGFWGDACLAFPPEAQTAFNYGVGIWGGYLDASAPIVIEACWSNMGSGSILGHGGAIGNFINFDGAPVANTFYPAALANDISGQDINDAYYGAGTPEIAVAFNSAMTGWYHGTDGNPGTGKIDFVSVVLHEICHGLGFLGTMDYDDGNAGNGVECNGTSGFGCWGWSSRPAVYDLFAVDDFGQSLINTSFFGNPSAALGTKLTTGKVFFNGPSAVEANGSNVKLYAPNTWSSGSSYAHLDQIFNGTVNALMTYSISTNEADHDPGPVTLGILEDIGWTIISSDTTPPPAPISLTATPGSWTNINNFSINGTNPSDPSGIVGAWYKVGAVPTTDTDGTYTTSKPFNAAAAAQGGQLIYVWLQDGAGNKSFENRSSTTLYYDSTAPTDGTLTSTKGNGSVSLSWNPAYDTGGSGLASSNRYIVKRNTGSDPNAQCANGTQVYLGAETSTTATGLSNGQTYYFRVCAYDTAGNISQGATASSTLNVNVQFNSSPTGRTVIVDGGSHIAPWATTWSTASNHTINVTSPQTDGTASKQYVFSSWSDGGAQGRNITPLVDTTYTATFLTQYDVTTSAGNNGTIAPDCSAGCWSNSGVPLQLTAIPDSGYVLSSWGVDCLGADLTTELTPDGPKTCSASFSACGDKPVQNSRTNTTFDFIGGTSNAYASAETGDTLRLIATTFGDTLDFDRTTPGEITVTLEGGYGCGYTGPSSLSIITGPVSIGRGTVIMDRIVIK